MEEYAELLEALNAASQEDLSTAESSLREKILALAEDDTDEAVTQMAEYDGALSKVKAEQAGRASATADRQAKRDEILSRATLPVAEDEPAPEDDESTEDDEAVAPVAEEVVAEDPAPVPVAVAASVTKPRPAAPGKAKVNRPTGATVIPFPVDRTVITASGSLNGIPQGAEIDIHQVGVLFAEQVERSMRRGGPVSIPIATFTTSYPEELTFGTDMFANTKKLMNVISPEAVVAAGGTCAPTSPLYSQKVISTSARPLRDSLAQFNGARGGVNFVSPPTLADIATGAGNGSATRVITEAQDGTAGYYDATPKPCQVISCGDAVEVFAQIIPLCLQIGNFNKMTFIELWDAWWANALAAHARLAENTLWNGMCSLSTAVSAGQVLGTFRDVFATLDRVAAAFRSRHRTGDGFPLHLWSPSWLRDQMRTDLLRQLPGDDVYGRASALIAQALADRNINVTWTLEAGGQEFGPQGVGPATGWPSTVEVILGHEGVFTFLDSGRLDFGMEIRDSALNAANNVQAMFETFENVFSTGIEPLCLTMDVCASGETSAAADITTAVCTSGS